MELVNLLRMVHRFSLGAFGALTENYFQKIIDFDGISTTSKECRTLLFL